MVPTVPKLQHNSKVIFPSDCGEPGLGGLSESLLLGISFDTVLGNHQCATCTTDRDGTTAPRLQDFDTHTPQTTFITLKSNS